MNITKEEYAALVRQRAKKSPLGRDMAWAFLVGGAICALGQYLMGFYRRLGLDQDMAGTAVSVTLIGAAALLTGLGWFDKLAKRAGAGTLVPITGFANAVASPAIDSRSEGLVLGVGAKIFTVAGPVLLYGTLSGALYGVIYWLIGLFH